MRYQREVAADRGASFSDAVIGSQLDLLVFDPAPQPIDKNMPRDRQIVLVVDHRFSLSKGSIALDGGKRHLGLESRRVVPARSSRDGLS
jgi:hypothetical protein